jgi:NADPH-dependent curcumin reductase CurA
MTNRRIVLKSRPVGEPAASDFELIEGPIPEPAAGQFVAKNIYLGLAPAARLRMSEGASYAAPTPLGSVVYGQSAGIIIASRNERFQVGDKVVVTDGGWQDYTLTDGALATKVDESKAPLASWLGILGVSGQTAYGGLLLHGQPKSAETVVVSAASGAVGGAVGQIARIKGCRVIGIAGGEKKCAFVKETLGFEACVDHRATGFDATLREACAGGVDVYFDNVGGAVRDAVFPLMNNFGRIVVCGLIAE